MPAIRLARKKLPKLPLLLHNKIYKTGQTRGADDDEIYQNRVGRSSTVLIPYNCIDKCLLNHEKQLIEYEKGFIVLIPPKIYFSSRDVDQDLAVKSVFLGQNAVLFYETRTDWDNYPPDKQGFVPASSRSNPLNGQYVARIPATTSVATGEKILKGFTTTSLKGAGIRVYEYADNETIKNCRLQLEALFWMCADSLHVAVKNGMSIENASLRKDSIMEACSDKSLLDIKKLQSARVISATSTSMCPLCLRELGGQEFLSKMVQAEGREVNDLTITQANLFHIKELRYGEHNHQPYNLGWGHHHCNVVVKDSGIFETLRWMNSVLKNNASQGFVLD
jgi:hypothetical protein